MILGPTTGELDDDAVLEAYPWPLDSGRVRWVRAMMVTTLDGAAAGPDGLSGTISGAADRSVFDAVRRLADVVLIGAGTMRAERYGPIPVDPDLAQRRAANGQAPAPVLAIVSHGLDLPWEEKVFTDSAVRPLVLTGPDPDADAVARAEGYVDVVRCSDTEAPTLIDTLVARGLPRIVCEGGPSLLEAIVAADLLDEADITVSPMFAGTASSPRGNGLAATHGLTLRHVLTRDSFLMARYVRDAS